MTSVLAQAAHSKLILVRHGQADNGHDPALSAFGRQQAARLGAQPGGRLLHSPRRRAHQTTMVLAPLVGLEPTVRELADDLTPVPALARRTDYPDRYLSWLDTVPPEERDIDGQRLTASLWKLADLAAAAPIVVVTEPAK